MIKKFVIILFVALVAVCEVFPASVSLRVMPSRGKSRIDVGDGFYLEITVSDVNGVPSKPELPGAKLMYFNETSNMSSYSMDSQGHSTSSVKVVYTATLRAEKEGSYSFGPITVGGIKSNSVKYNIGAAMPSQQNGQQSQTSQSSGNANQDDSKPRSIGKGDQNLFLRATVSSSNAYEQQALVYTVKLYSTYTAIKFVGATASPKFDGFVVEESKDISSQLTFENYEGKNYATAVIARYIIFPQMTGSLKVTGNTYTIAVDRREYFHDSFWGTMSYSTPLQLNVSPNDLVINVKELPSPKPVDFSGAVGKFRLTSELKSNNFKTNQAASIDYILSGTGNIKYAQLPDLSALYPPELEIYTPTTKQDINVSGSNVSGSITYEYSFMPLDEGDFKIPEIRFVYFDPETGKYETSVAKGYNIHVGKGAAVKDNGSRNRLKFDSELQQVKVTGLQKSVSPWIYRFSYWLWYLIPVILLLAAIITVRAYISRHADMLAFKSQRANKFARRRLRKAEVALKHHNREAFYDELLTALWGYLGDKLKMPTSELLRDNLRQVLSDRGIETSAIDKFIGIIDEAEFAKYSSAGGDDNMKKNYAEATDVINSLENQFKKLPSKK